MKIKIEWDVDRNWAWRCILEKHGWKQSQATGAWYRKHDHKRTEIVAGRYIPHYEKEVYKLIIASKQILSLCS